jgi:tRNA-2-methylthio-N6-dimethylallyladenosine synthase
MPVLFERAGRHPGQLVGRSPYLQAVHAKADLALIGRVVEVAIEAVRANSLAGGVRMADQVSP